MINLNDILEKFNFDIVDPTIFKEKNSCVVIGNSGNALNNKNGSFIDSLDCVIRFNHAKIHPFEEYIGSKTTIRLINVHAINGARHKFSLSSSITEHKEIFSEWQDDYILDLKNEILINKHSSSLENVIIEHLKSNNTFVFGMNDKFNSVDSPTHPHTSGFIGLMISLRFFNEIYYTGFDFYSKENSTHYFESVVDYDRNCHPLELESAIFNYLETIGRIKKI